MPVFNEYIMPANLETLDQYLAAFNAASRGAIVLSPDGFTGDFLQESFFQAHALRQVPGTCLRAEVWAIETGGSSDIAITGVAW
jgi:hypothetical protein